MNSTAISRNVPLSSHPLYMGHDVDEARQVLSGLFTEVTVEPRAAESPFSAVVNGLELLQSTFCYCEYGHGMHAVPRRPLNFHTIQLIRSGTARFGIRNDTVAGNTRTGVMLSAGQQVKVRHSSNNSVLSFIVKDAVIRDVVSAWIGHSKSPPIRFQPMFYLSDPGTASFLSLLQSFVSEINRRGGILESPVALASFEHSLINYMLFGLAHNLSATLRAAPTQAGAKQVKQIEEYLETNAARPIDMKTLARVTGHSTNSIFRAFRKHRDYTPMQFLSDARMRLVRQRLLLAHLSSSVTKTAMECGFAHLGRFAAEYRRRFGETPSQTLKRAVGRQ